MMMLRPAQTRYGSQTQARPPSAVQQLRPCANLGAVDEDEAEVDEGASPDPAAVDRLSALPNEATAMHVALVRRLHSGDFPTTN